jgi:hypothetical protein
VERSLPVTLFLCPFSDYTCCTNTSPNKTDMHPLMTTHLRVPQTPIKFVHGAPDRNDCNSYLLVILHSINMSIGHTCYPVIIFTAMLQCVLTELGGELQLLILGDLWTVTKAITAASELNHLPHTTASIFIYIILWRTCNWNTYFLSSLNSL